MDVFDDPRVKVMRASDEAYEIDTPDGCWAVFQEGGYWTAGRYNDRSGDSDLGPFDSAALAIEAVLTR